MPFWDPSPKLYDGLRPYSCVSGDPQQRDVEMLQRSDVLAGVISIVKLRVYNSPFLIGLQKSLDSFPFS